MRFCLNLRIGCPKGIENLSINNQINQINKKIEPIFQPLIGQVDSRLRESVTKFIEAQPKPRDWRRHFLEKSQNSSLAVEQCLKNALAWKTNYSEIEYTTHPERSASNSS